MTPGVGPVLRRVPLGMLMIGALLALGGFGLLAGGVYLIVRGGELSVWAGTTAIVMAPAVVYFVYHLVRCAPWTWVTLVALTGLLFLSSVMRLALSRGFPGAAAIEIVIELITITYLRRPTVRSVYGWRPREKAPAD